MTRRREFLAAATGTVALFAGCSRGGPAAGPTRTPTPEPDLDVPDSLPDPALGDPAAPVVVDYYGDFACPKCESYHEETFGRLRENYVDTGDVRYVHHDFPKVSESSWELAGAARAVQHDVGETAFWTFGDEVYRAGLAGAAAEEIGRHAAETVGADAAFVERVVEEGAFRPFLERQYDEADAEAPFVPVTFVDGELTIPNYSVLFATIDVALEQS